MIKSTRLPNAVWQSQKSKYYELTCTVCDDSIRTAPKPGETGIERGHYVKWFRRDHQNCDSK